ncbi:hypothetical protein HYV88_00935 [Candidatus Woesearchaeota archaeon]|nr:hypothetical protein [Candidatus Woesearchaeota archaeon]
MVIELVHGPGWFNGADIIIDLVSIFVLSLIAFFSAKYYRINENRNYLYLAISFSLLASSFIFKNLINFFIYYKFIELGGAKIITLTFKTTEILEDLLFFGVLLYRLLTLFGFYILYSIYQKQSKATIFLISYLILVSTYFSKEIYYVFHTTAFVLLLTIIISYYWKHLNRQYSSTGLLTYSFMIIAISQIFFMVAGLDNHFYVAGKLIQLVGYILLLITFIIVIKYGRKKNKNRHHT